MSVHESRSDIAAAPGTGAALSTRLKRGPRPEEIALMRGLAAGSRPVTSGPIGRCVKRGWCQPVMDDGAGPGGRQAAVVFRLTEAGRALIAGPTA